MKHQLKLITVCGLLCLILLPGISIVNAQKTVKIKVDDPELITTESLKKFLAITELPNLVVRYSSFDNSESRFDLNYLYNVIEKEFLKAGYGVKDRALFDEVLSRSEDILDYEIIREKTNTDLIIEMIRLETDINYNTNSYYNNKGVKTILYNEGEINIKGASVEFKLILVEKNEIVGSYIFNYAPCENGCQIRLKDYQVVFLNDFGEKITDAYQVVDNLQIEEFIRKASKDLIRHLDKVTKTSREKDEYNQY